MSRLPTLILIATAAITVPLVAQGINLRPGRYETLVEMTLPNGTRIPVKNSECLTAADLKDVAKTFLDDLGDGCQLSNLKNDGKQMTFTASCKRGEEAVTMATEMSFTGDAYSAAIKHKSSKGEAMDIRMSGKRVGDCTIAP